MNKLPDHISAFIIWVHTQKDWYYEEEKQAFTRLRYKKKTPDELYQWYVKNVKEKKS